MGFSMVLDTSVDYPGKVNLSDVIDKWIEKVDLITSVNIRSGFKFTVDGTEYKFSSNNSDQQNFSHGVASALLAAQNNAAESFHIDWRGHIGGDATTLHLNYGQFLALAEAMGAHKQACLSAGWVIKESLKACTSRAQIDEVVANNRLELRHRDALIAKKALDAAE